MELLKLALVLWLATFARLCRGSEPLVDANVLRAADTAKDIHGRPLAQFVWRGELFRTPAEVKAAGGIFARGFTKSMHDGLDLADLKMGSSLYHHVRGVSANNPDYKALTQYVSTAADPHTAVLYAWSRDAENPGYLYQIAADSRIVDVGASLGRYYPYPAQKEFAAIGYIAWDQIMGHYEIGPGFDPKALDKLKTGQLLDGFKSNPDFDPQYSARRHSGSQPQLAGFPAQSPAWSEEPWKGFRAKSCGAYLKDFISDVFCNGSLCASDFISAQKLSAQLTARLVLDKGPTEETMTNSFLGKIAQAAELSPSAEEAAASTFARAAEDYGLQTLAANKGITVPELRAKLKALVPVPASTAKSLALKGGVGAVAVATLGLYVNEVIQAFSTNTSALQRTVVLTSLVPMVGCAVQATANAVNRTPDPLDINLCFVGDILLFTPAMPLGVLIHIGRFVAEALGAAKAEAKQRKIEAIDHSRVEAWTRYVEQVKNHFASDGFQSGLEMQIQADIAAILFKASEVAGIVRDNIDQVRKAAPAESVRFINNAETQALRAIGQRTCHDISQAKQSLANGARKAVEAWLANEAQKFNDEFFFGLGKEAGRMRLYEWRDWDATMQAVRERSSLLDANILEPLRTGLNSSLEHALSTGQGCQLQGAWKPLTLDPSCSNPCPRPGGIRNSNTVYDFGMLIQFNETYACRSLDEGRITGFDSPGCCMFRELELDQEQGPETVSKDLSRHLGSSRTDPNAQMRFCRMRPNDATPALLP